MIKVEPCKGCGGVVLVDDFMGVRVRCEATPLDAHTAGAALLAGLTLYRVEYQGGRPYSFGSASQAVLGALKAGRSPGLVVVAQHRCKANAVKAPQSASQEVRHETVPATPPKAPVAPSRPFSGPRTPSSTHGSVKSAANQGSNGPRCDGCGQPCEQGTYASIALGDLIQWAHHVDNCNGG